MAETKPQKSKQLAPIDEVRETLMSPRMAQQLKMALPAHIAVERFQRVAVTAIMQRPELLQADRASLYQACINAAQDGLLPDNREGTITIYNEKRGDHYVKVAKWMPMVWGIAKKVRNSGELAMLTAQVVYHGDKFRYWVDDDGEHIEHEPQFDGDRGEPRLVYALAKTKGGDVYIEVMTLKQIGEVMAVSRSKDKQGNPIGPWADWWSEMARKTAIRRLSKRLPMSTDKDESLRRVIERDDELYDLSSGKDMGAAERVEPPAPAPTNGTKRPRRLQAVVDAKPEPQPQQQPEPPADDTPPAQPAADQIPEVI